MQISDVGRKREPALGSFFELVTEVSSSYTWGQILGGIVMTQTNQSESHFLQIARSLGPRFAERAVAADIEGRFIRENYADLKEARLMSALVPADLGGGGVTHAEICDAIRELGRHCGSTALALSMHTHLVSAAVWRHRHGQPAEALLRKIAGSEIVLVSTGAGDWVDSNGQVEKVPGGYRVNAVKRFGSGSPAGDLLMTSAPYNDPERGAEVLVFPVSLTASGVTVRNDWDTMGMRATGSNSIELKDVFIPEETIGVRRPRGQWHPSWNVTMGVALPIIVSAYLGIAERAAELARAMAVRRKDESKPAGTVDGVLVQQVGELENALTVAQMAWREMVAIANDHDFAPKDDVGNRMLIRKTIAANAVLATVNKAVEVVGGSALFRNLGIERLWRDIQGAAFHPLPEKRQLMFTGRLALGMTPMGE